MRSAEYKLLKGKGLTKSKIIYTKFTWNRKIFVAYYYNEWNNVRKKQKFSPVHAPKADQAPVPPHEIFLLFDKSENLLPTLQMIVVLVE